MADIYGTSGSDSLSGTSDNDNIFGLGGDDTLDGGAGSDQLQGGEGNDTLIADSFDTVIQGGTGIDTLTVDGTGGVSLNILGASIEIVNGGTGDDNFTTFLNPPQPPPSINEYYLARTIHGNDGNDVLHGVYADGDMLYGDNGNDTLDGWLGADYLSGGAGDDRLTGWSDGNAGDTLVGGTGNDIYEVDSADVIIESANEGTDTVIVGSSHTLGENLENLSMTMWYATGDLTGNALNNVLTGNETANALTGHAGNDTLIGGAGSDTYVFNIGDGADTIQDTSLIGEENRIRFGQGLTAQSLSFADEGGALRIDIGANGDSIRLLNFSAAGQTVVQTVEFNDGSTVNLLDLINNSGNLNLITGSSLNDYLYGTSQNDEIQGLGGNDQLYGFEGNDILLGGAGNDTLFGDAGSDVLNGGAGNDSLQDWAGSDTYVFGVGSGIDTVQDWGAVNEIDTVQLMSGVTPATLLITEDWVTNPGGLTLRLVHSDDQLVIQNFNSMEQIQFADGTVWDAAAIQARVQQVQTGTAGMDYLNGGSQGDYLQGLGGDDQLWGNDGHDALMGGAGNDMLQGGMGNDVLNGGAGNDQLQDMAGSDTYIFGVGSGTDIVQDWGWDVADVDTVLVTGGVTPNSLFVTQDWATNPGGLTLRLAQSDDQLVLQSFNSIEQIQFADGTVWDQAAIQARTQQVQTGTAGMDYLGGGFQGDYLQGLGGDDQLWGNDGHDALMGGMGNDYLQGGFGNDVLNGGSGNDQLQDMAGSDTYVFGVGSGIDTVQDWGWDVADVDSVLVTGGVTPNSLFVTQDWATNPGGLTLRLAQSDDQLQIQGFNSIEQIQFADGTVWDAAMIQARVQQVQTGTAGTDYLGGGFQGDYLQGLGGDDQLWGNDGHDALMGGAGNDWLQGGQGNDVLMGGAGNDSLQDMAGSDTYVFGVGSGIDTVQDWGWDVADVDTVVVGQGVTPATLFVTQDWATNPGGLTLRLAQSDDQLVIQNFNSMERIQFADGTVWDAAMIQARVQQVQTGTAGTDYLGGGFQGDYLQGLGGDDQLWGNDGHDALMGGAGNDWLQGGQGNDVLNGGAGNDSLQDMAGSDTYIFGVGSGIDTVQDWGWDVADVDSVLVTGGVTPNSLFVTQDWATNPGGLTLRLAQSDDQLQIQGFNSIEQIQFADGTVWDAAAIQLKLQQSQTGTEGDDYLWGTAESNYMQGFGGNDSLYGNDGDDVLLGGAGDDFLQGGMGNDVYDGGAGTDSLHDFSGSDTYRWGTGSGQDTVLDLDFVPGTIDRVEVQGATPSDVIVTRDWGVNPNAITLRLNATGETLTLLDWFNPNGQIEEIRFADGTVWDQAAVLARLETTLTGTEGDDNLYGSELADTIHGLGGNDQVNGQTGDDVLLGGAGDDFLQGGMGNDVYDGGAGTDSLHDFSGSDTYRWGTGSGQDTVLDLDFVPGTIDRVEVQGATPSDVIVTRDWGVNPNAITLRLNATGDALTLLDWFNPNGQIEEIRFADGTVWDQAAVLARLETTLTGTEGDDNLYGSELADTISGLGGNDQVNGQTGNDVLDGGTGADQMSGGSGDDTFIVDNSADVVTEFTGDGNDQVYTSVSFSLAGGADIETMILTGTDSIDATGSSINNTIIGNSGNNTLDGGLGSDLLQGGEGHDVYVVDNVGDSVTENLNAGIDRVQSSVTYSLGANIEQLTLAGSAAINGTGNALDNVLVGNSAVNTLAGGAGNDTYIVGAGDVVVEGLNEGMDLAQSDVSFFLTDNVEDLTLTGTGAINGTGNSLNNVLLGNVAANVLDGAAGADHMQGGQGDDTYIVEDAGDGVLENANEGIDTIQASISYTLGASVEHLTLTGTAAISATGNELNNALTGNSAANVLDGGAGSDTMSGGQGNDTYVVDSAGDAVIENANEGTDLVSSSISYVLGANVENLTLTGAGAINGTGNSLNNVLTGNSAANILDGAAGADSMSGGLGDDTYVVDHVGDTVIEAANEGLDTVLSGITYTLGVNVENLTLTGTSAINGTGNSLDNVLSGNSAANVLSGGVGNDTYVIGVGDSVVEAAGGGTDSVQSALTYTLGTNVENLTLTGSSAINGTGNSLNNLLAGNSAANTLTGGAGNDIYIVGAGDAVVESNNNGTDTVQSSVTWTLGSNLENLTLTGSAAINGTGNSANNQVLGNAAANVLSGANGNDTLRGNAGNDTVNGGSGNDTYLFGRGEGQDLLQDSGGTADKIQYDLGIDPLDLVISRQANDLRLSIHGSTDYVTVQNWYTSSSNRTETIQAGNGQTLLSTQVDQLIQAMASFSQQTGLTWDQAIDQQPQQVQNILAANWQ